MKSNNDPREYMDAWEIHSTQEQIDKLAEEIERRKSDVYYEDEEVIIH